MIGSHRQRWSVHIVYDPYQVAMYCGGIMTMIDRLIDINVCSKARELTQPNLALTSPQWVAAFMPMSMAICLDNTCSQKRNIRFRDLPSKYLSLEGRTP